MKTNNVSSKAVLYLVQGALIAALYVVLTMLFEPDFVRAGAVPDLRNAGGAAVLYTGGDSGCDHRLLPGKPVFRSGRYGRGAGKPGDSDRRCGNVSVLRKHKYLVSVPPIVSNTLIVPWVLKIGYGAGDAVPFMMVTVGIGEILAVAGLGTILLLALERHKNVIFRMNAV